MATNFEKIRWKLYLQKRKAMFLYGTSRGLIRLYEYELIERLRNIHFVGIPASIILLYKNLCDGCCYDCALLLSLAFENYDYEMITAEIDGIKFNPHIIDKYRNLSEHYAAHRILKVRSKDGKEWVYDTSLGLVFEKEFYFKLEHPKIIKILTKQETIEQVEYQEICNDDSAKDKQMLPLVLLQLEARIEEYDGLYESLLRKELARFKEEIGYDEFAAKIKKYESIHD